MALRVCCVPTVLRSYKKLCTGRIHVPTMKPLDLPKGEKRDETSVSAAPVEAEGPIDFSKVEIEPLFKDFVDFETFAKSDYRAVKVLACEAVPKSKKLLKFTLDDGRQGTHHFKRHPRVLRAGSPGGQDLHRHHQPAPPQDDGHRLRGNLISARPPRGRGGAPPSSDGGPPHPRRREAVLRME